MGTDTVGSLLAAIANALQDALRILMFADKRGWGPDEFEQVRALEDALDEAKKDFQEMAPLVNGQLYYENDRRHQSITELRVLCTKFEFHSQIFKDWLRTGGPINPLWLRETTALKRELHRAQRRAAQRIFNADQEANARCLGAFLVYRRLREQENQKKRVRDEQAQLPQWQQQQMRRDHERRRLDVRNPYEGARGVAVEPPPQADPLSGRESLEALVPDCNTVGSFERFGDRDIAFVCDYCDGHIVWEDVQSMPSTRTAPALPSAGTAAAAPDTSYSNWQATATSMLTGEDKTIVFAPLAIANHLAAAGGVGWEARIWCPFCDDYTYFDHAGDNQTQYAQEEGGFADLASFQEHLSWHHTAVAMPALTAALPSLPTSVKQCTVM